MQNENSKLKILRKKYPKFVYEKFSWQVSKGKLKISFYFSVKPDIYFTPKLVVENVQKSQIDKIDKKIIDNLVFHLGLMEIPSYWKATCSPIIEIRSGFLQKEQISFWKNLIINGMGQFFFENKINFKKPNFLKIVSNSEKFQKPARRGKLELIPNRYLVPVGGGKDSVVTLEKLKKNGKEIGCFLVNPTKAARGTVKVAGIKELVIIKREIDQTLLGLNKKGYLNGHTPITAVLSFLTVLAAVLFNYKYIAFSNEKSANEGNLKYLGRTVNHQWSKSLEFEKKFRNYSKKYLVKNLNYFSYLRKYSELEIAKMFINYSQYFPVFSSCNAVAAKNLSRARWCGNCSKCLFVFAVLYPFLKKEQMIKIFGNNVFDNKKLANTMKGLINPKKAKPFECVGTKKESQTAFELSLKKAQKEGKVPYLLKELNRSAMKFQRTAVRGASAPRTAD